jgi:phosphoglycerate dehydrogenase-like enzyme
MKIAILDDYADAARRLADWEGLGEISVFHDTITDAEALIARLAPFDVICVMRERTPLPAEILAHLPKLRLIVTTGARNGSIDLATATAKGITICGTQSRKTTTAELSMALMLALNRRIVPEAQSLAHGGWQSGLGRDLAGLTLGLVGLGNIGAQMAALGRAFGMEVAAWSQNLTSERCAEHGVMHCPSLRALMQMSDVVSVHLVLSARSRGLIDAEALAAMKPGAVLINTARGPIVDQLALLNGLRAGRPAMAGIDVFDPEPLPVPHPLRDPELIASGRLLLTPHLGYSTEENFALFYRQTAEAVRAWQAGAPIRVIS